MKQRLMTEVLRELYGSKLDRGSTVATLVTVDQEAGLLSHWLRLVVSVDAGIKGQHFRQFCSQRKPAIGQDAVPTL
jgi:hypothetical protein